MRDIYQDITGSLTDYPDWYELFRNLQIEFDDDDEREYFWDMFLRSFYLSTHDQGYISRGTKDNPGRFYQESGIPASAVDWSEWRDLMGYGSRK